jgi:HAD superfamily hydrolase (TIGR01490 family)
MTQSDWTVIFDLDGTLIPQTSAEKIFFIYLLKNRQLSIINVLHLIPAIWTTLGNLHKMTLTNKRYLKNKPVTVFKEIARKYFDPRIEMLVFPLMHRIIDEHKKNGDKLLLLTGTLDFIAECFVHILGFDGYRATELETKENRYTGRVIGIQPFGLGKLEVLGDFKREFHFARDKTILYANIFSDRYVMNAVEKPIAVNPDKRLLKYAVRSKWKIINSFSKRVAIIDHNNSSYIQ